MLSRRASAGRQPPPRLSVELVDKGPLAWFDPDTYLERLRERVAKYREELLPSAAEIEKQMNGSEHGLQVGRERFSLRDDLPDSVFEEEARTLQEYAYEVDEWVGRVIDIADESWIGWYCQAAYGAARISIRNDSDRFLTDVELRLRTDFDLLDVHAKPPEAGSLLDARPPWPYGKPRIFQALSVRRGSIQRQAFTELSGVSIQAVHPLDDTVDLDGNTLLCHLPQLRPQSIVELDPAWLVLRSRPPTGQLHLYWQATASDLNAVVRGDLTVAVRERQTDVVDLRNRELKRIEAGERRLLD